MKLNEACQKTHPLAIDLFLLLILVTNITLALTAPQYEIIPPDAQTNTITINGKTTTITNYQPQTNNTLITTEQAKTLEQERKTFKRNITLFGTTIFILYALTQWNRWKEKIRTWKNDDR